MKIYRLMKSHNSTSNLGDKKKKAASAVHLHSVFDECAFKTAQFGSEEEKQQCDLNYCKCNMS